MNKREDYFAQAQSWADTQNAFVARERRVAWIIAGISTTLVALLILALVILLPLKSVEPYVVTVDRQSGAVQVAAGVSPGVLTQNEAVIQAELARYVRARETFDATDLPKLYRTVQLLSARDVSATYIRRMAASNPESPLRTLNRGDMLSVAINSVSIVSSGVAIVRFQVTRIVPGGTQPMVTTYVSAISFGFTGRPLRTVDRFDNPLGFQVTRYRRDVEGYTP